MWDYASSCRRGRGRRWARGWSRPVRGSRTGRGSCRGRCGGGVGGVDGVGEAEVVVGEQEAGGADAEDAAGTAVHDGFAVVEGEKAGDEVAGCAVRGREADDAIACADAGVARSVEGNEEA